MKHTYWFKDAVIYQIYPRSFFDSNSDGLGDIKGIIAKLDYLKDLGINAIWLSPVYDSPQYDNGYDIADYYNIWKPFGTLNDMKALLAEAHKRNIRVIMDLVVNHTSSEHKWFKGALKDKNSPYRNYYIIKKGKDNGKRPPNNWNSCFGGSAWEKINNSDEYYLHLFAKEQPDLNWENPKVREEIIAILRFWLDLGVDGFRCDVITLLSKDQRFKDDHFNKMLPGKKYYANGPRIHEYLKFLYDKAYIDYDVMTVGEAFMDTVKEKETLQYINPNNHELDMVFNFEHTDVDNYFGIKYLYRKFKLNRFKYRLSKYQKLFMKYPGWNSLFIENHDQRRSAGRFNTDLGEFREKSAKALATTYFLLRGTPFIYQGQEIGMQNMDYTSIDDFRDVEIINMYKNCKENKTVNRLFGKHIFELSRDNARTPMQWDDSIYAGFSDVTPWIKVNKNKDYINVKIAMMNSNSIYHYYKKLISLRKKYNELLKNGSYKLLCKYNPNIFAYLREDNYRAMLVIVSFSKKTIKNPLKKRLTGYELILSNDINDKKEILKPYDARIYLKNKINL